MTVYITVGPALPTARVKADDGLQADGNSWPLLITSVIGPGPRSGGRPSWVY